jgi:hypothetical protein
VGDLLGLAEVARSLRFLEYLLTVVALEQEAEVEVELDLQAGAISAPVSGNLLLVEQIVRCSGGCAPSALQCVLKMFSLQVVEEAVVWLLCLMMFSKAEAALVELNV